MDEIRGLIHEGIVGGIIDMVKEYRNLSRGKRIFFVCVMGIAGVTAFLGIGVDCFLEGNIVTAAVFCLIGLLWLITFSIYFYKQFGRE